MVEYGFYQVADAAPAALEAVLPDLLQTMLTAGCAISLCGTTQQLKRFDDALWSFQAESFLAHGLAGDEHAALQPILLEEDLQANNGATSVIFVGWEQVDYPTLPQSINRVVDLFNGAKLQKHAARARWKKLQEQKAQQAYFVHQPDGWIKQA